MPASESACLHSWDRAKNSFSATSRRFRRASERETDGPKIAKGGLSGCRTLEDEASPLVDKRGMAGTGARVRGEPNVTWAKVEDIILHRHS